MPKQPAKHTPTTGPWAGKRVVFLSPGQAAMESYVEHAPAGDELLVETICSLISAGTEGACLSGKANWVSYPHYPGYSNAGRIRSVGAKVRGLSSGERLYSQLPHQQFGLLKDRLMVTDGAQTEGFNTLESAAVIPENVTAEQATFASLGSVSLYGIRGARVSPGETIAVVGLGLVGQLSVQLARLTGGCPIIGIDPIASRRKLAEKMGADETIDPDSCQWWQIIYERFRGADVVLDATGSSAVLPQSVEAAAVRGRVVVMGTIYGKIQLELFPGLDSKDISLIGCHQPNNPVTGNVMYPWCQKRERQLLLNYLATKRLRVEELISHRFDASKAPEAYRVLQDPAINKMGIVLNWRSDK